jgi:hypothetical protein
MSLASRLPSHWGAAENKAYQLVKRFRQKYVVAKPAWKWTYQRDPPQRLARKLIEHHRIDIKNPTATFQELSTPKLTPLSAPELAAPPPSPETGLVPEGAFSTPPIEPTPEENIPPKSPKVPGILNPFLPWNPASRSHKVGAKVSLRRQANLIKAARLVGLLHLLPPGPKLYTGEIVEEVQPHLLIRQELEEEKLQRAKEIEAGAAEAAREARVARGRAARAAAAVVARVAKWYPEVAEILSALPSPHSSETSTTESLDKSATTSGTALAPSSRPELSAEDSLSPPPRRPILDSSLPAPLDLQSPTAPSDAPIPGSISLTPDPKETEVLAYGNSADFATELYASIESATPKRKKRNKTKSWKKKKEKKAENTTAPVEYDRGEEYDFESNWPLIEPLEPLKYGQTLQWWQPIRWAGEPNQKTKKEKKKMFKGHKFEREEPQRMAYRKDLMRDMDSRIRRFKAVCGALFLLSLLCLADVLVLTDISSETAKPTQVSS